MEENFLNTPDNEGSYKKAYLYSIRLLAKRDYSRYKLGLKLKEQGHSKNIIEALLDELTELKYLREDSYIEARIKGLMYKGFAPNYIIQKLQQENVTTTFDHIHEIFAEYNYTTHSQLTYLLEKKARSKTLEELVDFNFRKKLLRYFLTKGHSLNDGNQVIETYIWSSKNEETH